MGERRRPAGRDPADPYGTRCRTPRCWHNPVMRLWLARGSEVPIREQVVTQVVLGILSDDLPPGVRLPSTREIARRFRVHANTVSAAYRELERDGWIESRRG